MAISKEGTIRCYDAVAPLYSFFRKRTHKTDDEIMPFVLDKLQLRDGETVLDAGTGPGVYAIKIAERARAAEIHGVDLSPGFLKCAEENAREAGVTHINFREGDLENIPYADNTFDKLVCGGAISAVPNKDKAAGELLRVLKPGGTAIIIEPNKGQNVGDRAFLLLLYAMGMFNPKLRGFRADDIGRYYFNQESFHNLFAGAGFPTVNVVNRAGSLCAVCSKQAATSTIDGSAA